MHSYLSNAFTSKIMEEVYGAILRKQNKNIIDLDHFCPHDLWPNYTFTHFQICSGQCNVFIMYMYTY